MRLSKMKIDINKFTNIALQTSQLLPTQGIGPETSSLLSDLISMADNDKTFTTKYLNKNHQYSRVELENIDILNKEKLDKQDFQKISQIIKNKANGGYVNTNPYNFIGEMYYIAKKILKED